MELETCALRSCSGTNRDNKRQLSASMMVGVCGGIESCGLLTIMSIVEAKCPMSAPWGNVTNVWVMAVLRFQVRIGREGRLNGFSFRAWMG